MARAKKLTGATLYPCEQLVWKGKDEQDTIRGTMAAEVTES